MFRLEMKMYCTLSKTFEVQAHHTKPRAKLSGGSSFVLYMACCYRQTCAGRTYLPHAVVVDASRRNPPGQRICWPPVEIYAWFRGYVAANISGLVISTMIYCRGLNGTTVILVLLLQIYVPGMKIAAIDELLANMCCAEIVTCEVVSGGCDRMREVQCRRWSILSPSHDGAFTILGGTN